MQTNAKPAAPRPAASAGRDGMLLLSKITALALFSVAFAGPAVAQARLDGAPAQTSVSTSISLLHDRSFAQGVIVKHPDQQNRSDVDTLYPKKSNSGKNPLWILSQWHGLHSLAGTAPSVLADGGVEYKNPGKRIVFGPGNRLILGLNGADRGDHTSKHVQKLKTTLGITQDTWNPGGEFYRISDLASLELKLTARLTKAQFPASSTKGTAAVGFAGLHIRNVNPELRELVYFVVPLYDSRERTRRTVRLIDRATGGRFFIYGTGNESIVGEKSFHDMQWISADRDILPLVKDALNEAWKQPKFASYSRNLSDYTISQFGIRWEMSADMNVEMEFKDFDLVAHVKPHTPLLSIAANPIRIIKNKEAMLSWSASNVDGGCAVKDGASTIASGNSGTRSTGPINESRTYTLECRKSDGATETRSVLVRVADAFCVISASPAGAGNGETKLTWQAGRDEVATITPDLGEVKSTGSLSVSPASTTNYIMTLRSADRRLRQCNVVVPGRAAAQ